MTTQYTPILQLALPVTGELTGTWGDTVNDSITSMIEEAIAGRATISTWAGVPPSHTLTTVNGLTDEARCAMLLFSGAPGAAAEVICPGETKLYVVTNNVAGGYAVTIKAASGTGVSVPNGNSALVYCDGTNVIEAVTNTGVSTFSGGTTGLTPSVATNGAITLGGTLAIVNGGTGTTTATGTGNVVLATAPTTTNHTVTALKETKVSVSANDIDLSTGNYFSKTISGSTTLTVSNVPTTGTVASFIFDVINGGTNITWWAGVKWPAGVTPTLTTSGRDVLGFFSYDGGTTWNGFVLGKAMA